ncbi:sterol desaturase family protein [Caulobacter sp. S45]|uniref:sterol desaturase family protein n=1 Tax=Caulobacter sp. S45 TaxID=1641861 RepID=UPI001575BE71|nr:sterol desaturase family protein [Caulobacter sp. S45]
MIALTPALRLALVVLAPLLVMGLVRHVGERLWPAHLKRERLHGVALAVWGALFLGQALAVPALGGVATLLVNAAGGGLIRLPARGVGWWAGLAAYLLVMDLGEYLFHRAQHAVPALWAMHSLHHSDRAFDSATAARHFWLEPAIKTVTVWLMVGVLLRTPASVVGVYVAVSYYHFVVHSNTRLDFGRWSWVLNGPGYHRVHHSEAEEHFDVNFASLFPIFDVLTGAYRPPRPGERIQTGLDTGEEPQTVGEALVWPVRSWLRRPLGRLRRLAAA